MIFRISLTGMTRPGRIIRRVDDEQLALLSDRVAHLIGGQDEIGFFRSR
jgi:hypothetical protein